MTANNELYLKNLLQQGEGNLNICPGCFAANQRKKFCTNVVYLNGQLTCCYLGDKNQISEEAFAQKVQALKARQLW
jgi:hypothetical protein